MVRLQGENLFAGGVYWGKLSVAEGRMSLPFLSSHLPGDWERKTGRSQHSKQGLSLAVIARPELLSSLPRLGAASSRAPFTPKVAEERPGQNGA